MTGFFMQYNYLLQVIGSTKPPDYETTATRPACGYCPHGMPMG